MKRLISVVVLLTIFGAGLTCLASQNLNGKVQHVIVVIEENRTPDNLFHDNGVLYANGGDIIPPSNQGSCHSAPVTLSPFRLDACFDPDHSHRLPYDSWEQMYDKGAMDGACDIHLFCQYCTLGKCPPTPQQLQYTYVDNSTLTVQPYFDIANQYGFGNYFFQTNQGPSFPAHQFLFTGSSAPTPVNDPLKNWTWFDAENPQDRDKSYQPGDHTGCANAPQHPNQYARMIKPDNTEGSCNSRDGNYCYKPCFDHNTLADLLEKNTTQALTWKYYARDAGSLWTAPNAVSHICNVSGGQCQGSEWANVIIPPSPAATDAMAPIIEDIEDCKLPAVSWVIPDGAWSDHPGRGAGILGPSWVAAIVNAVGGPRSNPCPGGENYWNDTVIFVVWDDWGGWYDHVLPFRCDKSGTCSGYPQNGGGNQYVYGFRVPFLVISAYNKHIAGQQGFTGYVSGACQSPGNCNNEVAPYIHDFGSILNFIEYAFGADGSFLTLPKAIISGISPDYPYADYWAPDGPQTSLSCDPVNVCKYSLRDFFDHDFANPPRNFTPIQIPDPTKDAEFFENYGVTDGNQPVDPDDDAIEALEQ